MTSHSNSDFGPHSGFNDLLRVHPTELNIPLDFTEEEHSSCSIQLTNITDRIVAYTLQSVGIDLVSPDEYTYVGTILPRSTSSVTLTVNFGKEPPPKNGQIIIYAHAVKDGVKAEDMITMKNMYELTDKVTGGYFIMPVASYNRIKETNKSAAGRALTLATPGMSDSEFGPDSDFDDLLTVHPTELNNLFELNEETLCSIQLTNKTDRIVAYTFWPSLSIHMVSPDANTYVGTILPRSTFSVTVTVKLTTEPPLDGTQSICIYAYVVKDGVKAEDVTRENLFDLTEVTHESFTLPVVPAANLTSKGKQSKSSVRRQSTNERSIIELFSDDEIKSATNDLSDSSKIGNGGYGTVYKGRIRDTEVAIKIPDSSSQQGIAEFHQEMEVLGRIKHQNLVELIGVCIQSRALVYEFLPHGSVEDYLKKNPRLLTWQIRTRIVYEICSALTFLHSMPQPVVHGDLKPANILLDANFISKLSDFGLCRFLPRGTTTTTTTTTSVAFLQTENIKGTEWYIDPDFLVTGKLTAGCDVYSFGITILRLLTGLPAPRVYRDVNKAIREKSLMRTVDSTAGKWPENVAEYLAHMGWECCEAERRNSKLMKDLSTGLEDILANMDT